MNGVHSSDSPEEAAAGLDALGVTEFGAVAAAMDDASQDRPSSALSVACRVRRRVLDAVPVIADPEVDGLQVRAQELAARRTKSGATLRALGELWERQHTLWAVAARTFAARSPRGWSPGCPSWHPSRPASARVAGVTCSVVRRANGSRARWRASLLPFVLTPRQTTLCRCLCAGLIAGKVPLPVIRVCLGHEPVTTAVNRYVPAIGLSRSLPSSDVGRCGALLSASGRTDRAIERSVMGWARRDLRDVGLRCGVPGSWPCGTRWAGREVTCGCKEFGQFPGCGDLADSSAGIRQVEDGRGIFRKAARVCKVHRGSGGIRGGPGIAAELCGGAARWAAVGGSCGSSGSRGSACAGGVESPSRATWRPRTAGLDGFRRLARAGTRRRCSWRCRRSPAI